ncbi:hypothetical protein [Hyphomicrobium sp. CS1GBMeth3]|uniref:hypothetical protein n=1 Tax=Hyphomicrobium sp. CS1GBMeth3 TaxID=1892845 RepID=UPI000930DECD|nr:hypothetical protein [Hyphomicrobium sp. CS1GBMeth3]
MADANQKERRRAAAVQRRTFKALQQLGVDLETVPASDRDAIAIGERNIAALNAAAARMRQVTHPTAPTPERVAHAISAPQEIEVTPGQPKAHRFAWALEDMRDRLSARQYESALWLRMTYLATRPASRVADPTAVGGSSDPSKRLPLTERQEIAGRDLDWVMDRIEQPFRSCIRNFVLEEIKQGSERCLTVAEWGARTTGLIGEKASRAAGTAAIILACAHLANVKDAYDQWQSEQCSKTDRMMRSGIGHRAAHGGWIVALWDFCHRHGRLPKTQGEMDEIRASHDTDAVRLRTAPPIERDRWQKRSDRLTSVALRESDERRVRVA